MYVQLTFCPTPPRLSGVDPEMRRGDPALIIPRMRLGAHPGRRKRPHPSPHPPPPLRETGSPSRAGANELRPYTRAIWAMSAASPLRLPNFVMRV
jgi:hypothetical protein